jgi:hypothetical protein
MHQHSCTIHSVCCSGGLAGWVVGCTPWSSLLFCSVQVLCLWRPLCSFSATVVRFLWCFPILVDKRDATVRSFRLIGLSKKRSCVKQRDAPSPVLGVCWVRSVLASTDLTYLLGPRAVDYSPIDVADAEYSLRSAGDLHAGPTTLHLLVFAGATGCFFCNVEGGHD